VTITPKTFVESTSDLVILNSIRKKTFRAGDVYKLRHDIPHTTTPLMDGTISIVAQQAQCRDQNWLFTNSRVENGKHQRYVTIVELKYILSQTLNALKRVRTKSKL